MEVADINGDGHLDLLSHSTTRRVSVFFGVGTGVFSNANNYGGESSSAMTTGDLNNDGMIDLLAVSSSAKRMYYMLRTCGD